MSELPHTIPDMKTVALVEQNNNADVASIGLGNRELTTAETEVIRCHLSNARSRNTRLAYGTQWKLFVSWCKQEGFLPFPAEVSTIVLYLTHLGTQDLKYSKMEQVLCAIRAVHADNVQLLEGMDALNSVSFRHPHIKATLASIRRGLVEKKRNIVKKPRFFNQQEILSMVEACPDTPGGLMEKTILLLGVNSGLRASEICMLETADITLDDLGLDIRIRASKTDQFGSGEEVYVARLAPAQGCLDAAKAMEAWLAVRSTLNVGEVPSLFLAFRKGGNVLHKTSAGYAHGLTREAISSIIQRCASRAGIEVTNQTVSSHSLRHSMVTQAFNAGLDPVVISKTSRHKSMAVLMAYDQSSRRLASVAPKLWD
jgi:site-specific recombinase XerD